MKRFSDLTEQEVLALAITNEEEDSRIYRGFAEGSARAISVLRKGIRRDGGRGSASPHDAVRPLPQEIRRLSAADPPPGRQGFHPAQVFALADAAARPRARCASSPRTWSTKPSASIAKRPKTRATFRCASCWSSLRRPKPGHESLAHKLSRADSHGQAPAPRRMKPRGACSCCNMCSRASPG